MVGLLDVGNLRKNVELRGQQVEVRGLSATYIFEMLAGSDELRMIMAQKAVTGDVIESLINQFPGLVAEIIACGSGKPDDGPTIAFARNDLVAGETLDLLQAILELTFPRGVKSFIDGLTALAQKATGGRGWEAVIKSQGQSRDASPLATAAATPGATPPDNSQGGPT